MRLQPILIGKIILTWLPCAKLIPPDNFHRLVHQSQRFAIFAVFPLRIKLLIFNDQDSVVYHFIRSEKIPVRGSIGVQK